MLASSRIERDGFALGSSSNCTTAHASVILSNIDILRAIDDGDLSIEPHPGRNPEAPPFNTSAVDLRLGRMLQLPRAGPYAHSLRVPYDTEFVRRNSDPVDLETVTDWQLHTNTFVIGQTLETVAFRIREGRPLYSARVEGKSSRARLGLLVHFTAPTVHSGFTGTITLEMINLGCVPIILSQGVYICQLIIEEVRSQPTGTRNQFSGQTTPQGA